MSGPKHLWYGDWERDSEDAARARGDAEPVTAPLAPEPEPEKTVRVTERPVAVPPPPTATPRPTGPRSGAATSPRPRRRRVNRGVVRATVIVAALVLLVGGVAFGLGQLVGPHRSTSNSGNDQIAYLGVHMGVLPSGAVVLIGVDSGGPAARAGLHTGDVITEVEGRPVAAPVDVDEAVDALRVGDTIELRAVRGSHTVLVRPKLSAQAASAP